MLDTTILNPKTLTPYSSPGVIANSTLNLSPDVGRAKLPDNSGKAERRRPKPVR